jgi:hypothetical protein
LKNLIPTTFIIKQRQSKIFVFNYRLRSNLKLNTTLYKHSVID